MAMSKLRLLREVRRGADLSSAHRASLSLLAQEGLVEKIPSDYDYRLTEKGRLVLLYEEGVLEQRKLAAE